MSAAVAVSCRMCASCEPPRITEMIQPAPGAALICPMCDRRPCGHCKQRLIAGTERSCPACGLALKPLGQP